MSMFWTLYIFLLFCQSRAEVVEKEEDPEYAEKYIYKTQNLPGLEPIDFRCYQNAYSRLNLTFRGYVRTFYCIEPPSTFIGCKFPSSNGKHTFYPTPTGLDPMMEYYIHKLHEGIDVIGRSPKSILSIPSLTVRRKRYCIDIRMMGSTFIEYFETFHSDEQTCSKIEDIAKECYIFREMWFYWVRNLYERLCLDEDGCYNVMELYEDDMPHCVKYIANRQFKNASFGSWHHSIINYCQLTDVVPEAKDTKYDRSILFADDKTEDDLLTMCQFLRFRLLPEEGKEEEIREITLGSVGNSDTEIETERNSAALYSTKTSYLLTIM